MQRPRNRLRQLKAGWRDTRLLVRQFHRPLLIFFLAMLGFGVLFYALSLSTDHPLQSWVEGVYAVLTMSFLNSAVTFPAEPYLQIFFFLMPLVGVGILAQGLADFSVLFFNRRARGKEWEMAVASTLNRHIVLIGLGHLGFRIVKILNQIGEDVVVITLSPDPNLAENIRSLGVPLIEGDGTHESNLEGAGIRRARSIILCTQNDSLNLQIALKARSMQPEIDVILRIFDDDFAEALQKQFGFRALSATGMAAPVFASSATRVDITPPITIDGQPNCLARMIVTEKSALANLSLGDIEDRYNVSVVMLSHAGQSDAHPSATLHTAPGDTLAVLGSPQAIQSVAHDNND